MSDEQNIEVIEAVCCCFPDGTNFWVENVEAAKRAVRAWKSLQSDSDQQMFREIHATNGFVIVRMPRDKYIAIGASNGPMTVAFEATP